MSVVIKTVRVRGRISTEGDYWKNPAPNSLGMGDLVLTLEKKGVKDYEVVIRPIHVKKNSEGEYLQQPNTVYSTIGNPGSDSFGIYPSIYGSSFDIEPKPSNDVYKTTDDFITKFISNRNLPANLKQNYGRPSSGDFFRADYAGLTQAPPFYEIIQDPFDPTSVPVHTEGYFNIWNQWVLEINTPVFRSELPTSQIGGTPSQIGGTPSQIGGTPSTTGLSQSILLNVVFPSEFGVKVREDVPKFKIWVGDPQPEEQVDGFITEDFEQTDEEGNIVELSSEYTENEFTGSEEEFEVIKQKNSIDDAPTGPAVDNIESDGKVDKSEITSGPVLNSKLTNKSGTSMINLAGHRLTPILKDLQSYLNKNGYTGAKIGNNGVMRDLKASAYPSSPARAAASLHGAGLAIDVTFNIPGFKWSGIGDNGNLSNDANLTKVIAKFVKGQGDITWGASWGKGSKPSEGVINGRGITEYHHFEIRSDLIPKYWEPVKDELAKFGFKPSDLTTCGTDTNLHKLMKKLLDDQS